MSDNDLQEISLELIEFGRLVEEANAALRELVRDAHMRPALEQPRTLTITVKLEPNGDPHGLLLSDIEWQVKAQTPPTSGMKTKGILRNGKLLVSAVDADARQMALNITTFEAKA